MKATDALRSVQEDLTDAWAEVDEFITNFGADEQANLEEVVEEPTEEPVEESEAEVAEAELVEEPAESEELWAEGQAIIADSLEADLIEE